MTVTPVASGAGSAGYTLIELVLVIVIAGVLAAVAMPRFFDQSTFTERGFADELAGALRAAQKAAVATDCPARVTVASNSYAVAQQAASGNTCNTSDTSWSTPVLGQDGQIVQNSAPTGISVSPAGAWVFGGSGALTSYPGTTLNVGAHTITIDALTGFVQVQ